MERARLQGVRSLERVLGRWAARADDVRRPEQSAFQRARVDTSAWAGSSPIRFGLLTAACIAGGSAVSVWLADGLALGWQVTAGIAGAAVGFVLAAVIVFTVAWVTAPVRQRNEARRAIRARSPERDQAFAEAWKVNSEVSRRTGFAERWLGGELDLEDLKSAVAPMPAWEASKLLFAHVLSSESWRALVQCTAGFEEDWNRLHTLAQRAGTMMTVPEKTAFLDALQDASERLIAAGGDVALKLEPLMQPSP
jgi:hypothetical protein